MRRYFNRHKYGAKRTKCLQGHSHPSRLESNYCDQLHLLLKNGDLKEVVTQKRFEYYVNNILICRHYVDFYIIRKDGSEEVHETKGMESDIWRIKKRLFEALYPTIPYVVIK